MFSFSFHKGGEEIDSCCLDNDGRPPFLCVLVKVFMREFFFFFLVEGNGD